MSPRGISRRCIKYLLKPVNVHRIANSWKIYSVNCSFGLRSWTYKVLLAKPHVQIVYGCIHCNYNRDSSLRSVILFSLPHIICDKVVLSEFNKSTFTITSLLYQLIKKANVQTYSTCITVLMAVLEYKLDIYNFTAVQHIK